MTTANMERSFWKTNPEWYRINEKGEFVLTPNAPTEAVKSFEKFSVTRKDTKCPFKNIAPVE